MAEIVNLRTFRKQQNRQQKSVKTARNRSAFGRGKADKVSSRDALERDQTALDGKKLTPDDGDGDG